MPISYEVKKLATTSATTQVVKADKGQQKRVRTLTEEYEVLFDKTTVEAYTLDPAAVGTLSGVPQAGGWSYYDAINQRFYPNFNCRTTSCERDESMWYRFIVTANYSDESTDDQGQDLQPDAESYTPSVTIALESRDQTVYSDNVNDPIILPTGSWYNGLNPIRKVPTLTYTVHQIENTFDEDDLESRGYTVNSSSWKGHGAGKAMITGIQYTPAKIPVGAGTPLYVNAFKVTYTIQVVTGEYKSLDDDGGITDKPFKHGYLALRADNWANAIANDPKSKVMWNPSNPSLPSSIYLKSDGTCHPATKQYGVPPMDLIATQPKHGWAFLRT